MDNTNRSTSTRIARKGRPNPCLVLSFQWTCRILYVLFLIAFIRLISLSDENLQYLEQRINLKNIKSPALTNSTVARINEVEKTYSGLVYKNNTSFQNLTKHSAPKNITDIRQASFQIKNVTTEEQKVDVNDILLWKQRLKFKLSCLNKRMGGFYLYHFRKAAGTTIRSFMKRYALSHRVSFHETEGKVLHPSLLQISGIISLISLRNPIDRIKSLYWYEHILWYIRIVHKPQNARCYRDWVSAWLDESAWKREFTAANPGNNYMEIENYYVKALIGWNKEPLLGLRIGEEEYKRAKTMLESFDIVLITEWLSSDSQSHFMDKNFPGRFSIKIMKDIQIDPYIKSGQFYREFMEKDEVAVNMELIERNKYDIMLYNFAMKLVKARLATFESLDSSSTIAAGSSSGNTNHICSLVPGKLPSAVLQAEVGVFRPPKHKGPL